MAGMKIRREDTVRVIAGKDRGKTGRVLRVDPKTGDPTRVGIKREGGRRVRIAKRSGQEVD